MTVRYHVPVLLEEVLSFLPADPEGVCVDGTLGGGGHARALAERLGPGGRLIGIDRDPESLAACEVLERGNPGRVKLVRGNFGDLRELLRREGLEAVSGILLDLGLSSRQVDEGRRGFSFLRDGPLDMRMGPSEGPSAADLLTALSEEELARLFLCYGEEPRAARVARAVAEERRRRPISTTGELARIVERALGRRGSKHPATRVFQALRIAVNREVEALEAVVADLPELLLPGGRVVVIAYHSLEDRIVKNAFRAAGSADPEGFRILTPKVVKPSRAEIQRNPRARSARLRAAERLTKPAPQRPRQGGPS